MLPLLRELPEGEVGERVMTKALHLTFSLTTLVYATIGLAGYILFGDATPENILGGFKGGPLPADVLELLSAQARARRERRAGVNEFCRSRNPHNKFSKNYSFRLLHKSLQTKSTLSKD